MMQDRLFWLHSWKGVDIGCKRKLLRSKAIADLGLSRSIKYIHPIAHSLYKIWLTDQIMPREDVTLKSYRKLADLTKDTTTIWKRTGTASHP